MRISKGSVRPRRWKPIDCDKAHLCLCFIVSQQLSSSDAVYLKWQLSATLRQPPGAEARSAYESGFEKV